MPRRCPALLLVHVVWATYRRRPILPVSFDPTLAAIFGRKAKGKRCVVLAVGIAHDHVHVLLRLAPSIALADIVQCLKGASAFDVNQRRLLSGRLSWQDGYWAESLALADVSSLVDYLRHQRLHHDDSHPAESWQSHNEPS